MVALSGTYNRYTWNGSVFEDVTIMDPYEVQNKDYYIRIEQNSDGSCTYRCWNGGSKTGKPDIVIQNGQRHLWGEIGLYDYNRWVTNDESVTHGESYIFINKGYRYEYRTGWDKGHAYETLDIYNPKDKLIYCGEFNKVGDY